MSAVGVRETAVNPRGERDLRLEWQTLTSGAGVTRLSDFGVLRIDGLDHVSWLDNLVTANVEEMSVDTAVYALLLEAKGHVVADFVVIKQTDSFLLYTSRAALENLLVNLRRSIFRDKVTLTDVSDQFNLVSLQGPKAGEILQNISGSNLSISESLTLSTSFSVFTLQFASFDILTVRNPRRTKDSFELLMPRGAEQALWDGLVAKGAYAVGFDALDIVRVEAGIPWYGVDFDETRLAPEARLDEFIAENKGCYPGQEVIARIRNLGHVNRLLVQFQIEDVSVPSRGDIVFVEDKEAGLITSSVWSYAKNAPLALGYIMREWATDGVSVWIVHDDARLNATIKIPSD